MGTERFNRTSSGSGRIPPRSPYRNPIQEVQASIKHLGFSILRGVTEDVMRSAVLGLMWGIPSIRRLIFNTLISVFLGGAIVMAFVIHSLSGFLYPPDRSTINPNVTTVIDPRCSNNSQQRFIQ